MLSKDQLIALYFIVTECCLDNEGNVKDDTKEILTSTLPHLEYSDEHLNKFVEDLSSTLIKIIDG